MLLEGGAVWVVVKGAADAAKQRVCGVQRLRQQAAYSIASITVKSGFYDGSYSPVYLRLRGERCQLPGPERLWATARPMPKLQQQSACQQALLRARHCADD